MCDVMDMWAALSTVLQSSLLDTMLVENGILLLIPVPFISAHQGSAFLQPGIGWNLSTHGLVYFIQEPFVCDSLCCVVVFLPCQFLGWKLKFRESQSAKNFDQDSI